MPTLQLVFTSLIGLLFLPMFALAFQRTVLVSAACKQGLQRLYIRVYPLDTAMHIDLMLILVIVLTFEDP